jgi:hypothetical protein
MTNNISFGELLMFADIGRQNAIVANNRMPAVGAAIGDSLVKFGRRVVLTARSRGWTVCRTDCVVLRHC